MGKPKTGDVHLGIEERGRSLDDRHSLVEDLFGKDFTRGALDNSGKVESQVLGVHLGREAVGERLLLASGDGEVVAGRRQVAEDNRRGRSAWSTNGSEERTADKEEVDGLGLLVGDVEDGLSGMAVDKLDSEDLAVREGSGNGDCNVGRGARILERFLLCNYSLLHVC